MADRICARCGRVGESNNIFLHHKDCNHFNDAPENQIYLCTECHALWHKGRWRYEDCNLENSCIENYKNPFTAEQTQSKFYGTVFTVDLQPGIHCLRVPKEIDGAFKIYLNPDGSFVCIPSIQQYALPKQVAGVPKYYTLHFNEKTGEIRYLPVMVPLYPMPKTGVPERDIDYVR